MLCLPVQMRNGVFQTSIILLLFYCYALGTRWVLALEGIRHSLYKRLTLNYQVFNELNEWSFTLDDTVNIRVTGIDLLLGVLIALILFYYSFTMVHVS